jgi:hypothetical protein
VREGLVTFSAASAVSVAVFALLQDATLLAALPGGWHDDVPQQPTYPFGLYEIAGERDERGLGTGGLPALELRTHIYSQFGGMAEAQAANRLTIAALKDAALTVVGYQQCGLVFYDETVLLRDELVNGVKVHELVSMFRIYVEEA